MNPNAPTSSEAVSRAFEAARCTCKCPDGPGQHLCGCHTYDTPHMVQLRELYQRHQYDFYELLHKLLDGKVPPAHHHAWVSDLEDQVGFLKRIAAAMGVEDFNNPDGRHDNEPWR